MLAKTFLLLFALTLPATIQETPIIAETTQISTIYSEKTLQTPIGELQSLTFVEILQDFSSQVYKIKDISTGLTGWIAAENLSIPPETPTDKTTISPKHLETFVNSQNYISNTNFLLLTDINRQKIHVFSGTDGAWRHKKTFTCSTGLNTSPTTRGAFTITERGPWFYSERLSSGAKFWMRFNEQYLIHSIPMDKNKSPIPGENTVGTKLSNGCIRLLMSDTRWLYENIPDGTAIIII